MSLRALIKAIKQNRRRKRRLRELGIENEVSMFNQAVVTQIVLGVLRHAMTAAAPLGVTVSDNFVVELAAILVGLGGLAWSAVRKVKAG